MRMLGTLLVLALVLTASARAHNFDEYLQSAQLSLHAGRLDGALQLHPGNGVADRVIALIDADGDRIFSAAEGEGYAGRVMGDLALLIDGALIDPEVTSVTLSPFAEVEDARGTISITFSARLPAVAGERRLSFRNGHAADLSVYVVTAAAPEGDVQLLSQERSDDGSTLRLAYAYADTPAHDVDFGNFSAMLHLGMDHIAEGTDHLLFLLVLLLPAPLVAAGRRWSGTAGAGQGFVQIVKVVTAFTLGHSLTLALAALGLVTVPSRPVEVLIAVSILVSAVHAIRPAFPGKEAFVAVFFGLIHGLAFASTIRIMDLTASARLAGLLGFNLGIEAMQLVVIAAVMPSLVLLSRSGAYRAVRIGGASFAAVAAAGWISERLFGTRNVVDVIVQSVAAEAAWLALGLFAVSLVCWRRAAEDAKTSGQT
ncbi:MAG: HupE/UreJ family protein [Rhodospirillaceae bacterium]